MIWIFRKANGRKRQGIDDWQPVNRKLRRPFPQDWKVMADQVMAKKAISSLREVIKLAGGPLECPGP